MAIRKINSPGEHIDLRVDNGDLQALNEVMEKFNFKDEEAALRFGLIVLLNADETGNVYVERGDQKVKIAPNPSLFKQNAES